MLKDKAFVFEVPVVLPESGVELVKCMQVCLSKAIGGGDGILGGEDLNPRDCALKGVELFERTNGNWTLSRGIYCNSHQCDKVNYFNFDQNLNKKSFNTLIIEFHRSWYDIYHTNARD